MLRLTFLFFAFSFSSEVKLEDLKPLGHCELELEYTYYSLCYSEDHRQALWAFHHLNEDLIQGPQNRINDYKRDHSLQNPVGPRDYRRSGFDRGHLVPAADMKLNRLSMTDTFYMTNMSPQRSGFNSGIWRSLEMHIRRQVLRLGEALVVTAPVLLEGENYPTIPSGVSIPKHYYKIAYYPESSFMEAFIIPNESQRGAHVTDFLVSVDELEKLTGLDFYSSLEDQLEDLLEQQHQSQN